jgi:phosphoglycolate phosphatase
MGLITIACLDMAGTTVADDGGVIAAFVAAIERGGLVEGTPAHGQAMKTAQATMGQSKIEVFRQIFTDEADAQRANAAFEECYAASVTAGGSRRCPARPR